jgi:hypothetical protein
MRKRALFAVVFVAAVSLFVALGAGSSFAYSGFSSSCSGAGSSCHGSDGPVPVCTPGLNDGTNATYTVAGTGMIEWAVFNGSTKVAGHSEDLQTPTFTVPVGATYTVYAVYGPGGPASSGAFTTITPAGGATNFTITPTAGTHGAISPATPQTVASGAGATFAITPDAGYHVADVLVNGASVGAVSTYTFTNVTKNSTISATFAEGTSTFSITTNAGPNGSISPAATQTVASGADATFTVTPAAGYYLDTLTVNGSAVAVDGRATTYVFKNVTADQTIAATFQASPTLCTVTPTVVGGFGGSVMPTSTFSMPAGSSITCYFFPFAGYHVGTILVDGVAIAPSALNDDGSYTFQSVNRNHTLSVSFVLDSWTVVATAGAHGSISPAATQTVVTGSDVTYTIAADQGYHTTDVLVNGVSVGRVGSYTFHGVAADSTISATFAADVVNYTITPSVVGFAGSISPNAVFTAASGSGVTFFFTPNAGYEVATVTVDGVAVASSALNDDGSYTFSSISSNHTISVSFVLTPPSLPKATTLKEKASASSLRLGKYVTISSVLGGGVPAGTHVRYQVRLPHKSAYLTITSTRGVSASGASSIRYKLTKRGTYYFRARFMGITGYLGSISNVVKVTVK